MSTSRPVCTERHDRGLLPDAQAQECVWLQHFANRDQAFRVIADWLDRYDAERPHSALGYLTPKGFGRNWRPDLYKDQKNTTSVRRSPSHAKSARKSRHNE